MKKLNELKFHEEIQPHWDNFEVDYQKYLAKEYEYDEELIEEHIYEMILQEVI